MKIATSAFIASILAAGVALAQTPEPASPSPAAAPPSKATFESLDKDADGRLSMSEAQSDTALSSKFSSLDKQGKGYLTKDEYSSYSKDEPKDESKQ